jgi:serine protease AprX
VMAQGVYVWVANAEGELDKYTHLNGTSFSCPLTAGVAACLIQARPNWSLARLVRAMKFSASRANTPDNYYGWGLVNALGALNFDTAGVPAGRAPLRFALEGANPMRLGRAPVSFRFGLAAGTAAAEYAVRVYDVTGRLVRTLWTGWLNPDGVGHTVPWDGTGDSGALSRPGLYLVSFEAGSHHTSIRLVAIR